MPIQITSAPSAIDLHNALKTFRDTSTYEAKRIALCDLDAMQAQSTDGLSDAQWRALPSTGDIGRGDKRFFEVTAMRIAPHGLNGLTYCQPITAETEEGAVALVCDSETGDLLVDMKSEPGNDPARKHIVLAPTLQASKGRLELAAQGSADMAPNLLGALVGFGFKGDATVQQDGGRFYGKRNAYGVVTVPNKAALAAYTSSSMIWTKAECLADPLNRNEMNCHLLQCLGFLALKQSA